MPVETVTVLFTDLVGSTSLSSTVGPSVAEDLRREHFALLREAISEAGGEEVKNLGDGLMVTFASASSAVACGVGMQQRVERRNREADEQLSIRVGIAHGEAERAEDDWFGPPVIEAARVCARAKGDQVLVGELARMMAAGRGEQSFTSVGALELKGLSDPVEAFEVAWEPLEDAVAPIPLPLRLRGVPPVAYVGRGAERERLAALWEAASGGLRQAVLISGEPGIGKTRLATHTALELHAEGATVLVGRCDEDFSAPYGAWIQALSHYVEHASDEALDSHLERNGGELARLIPALRLRCPDLPPPTKSDPETERYLLFAAVAGLLEEASADRPIALVVDDLHWADKPTLGLLKHVVTESPGFRLLLLGTYRESDLSRDHPLTDALAHLRGVSGVERLRLEGLGLEDVVSIMEAAAGHEIAEAGRALAADIAAETDGNPFFVTEMLRHLLEAGALAQRDDGRWELRRQLGDFGLPQSVREVIGRRVERLGERAHGLLRLAAVIGRDFEVDLLVRLAREDEDEVLAELEGAVAASVLIERSDPGTFSFAHALINHTLYEEIGPTRRGSLHQRVAEALEATCGADPGPRVTELARHWSAATTTPLEGGKALSYSLRAGERALAELAPDEAVRWFSHAHELIDKAPEADPSERCELLIMLGEAQRQAGESAFRETLLEAARIAEELGDADRMARAALANNRGYASTFGEVDEERVALLERAIELDGLADPARCARLLSLEAMELQFDPDHERRRALAEEALALGHKVADERTLALVLRDYLHAVWCVDNLDRRREVAEELERLAARIDDPIVEIAALISGLHVAAEAGRLSDARQALERLLALTERLGQPGQRWHALRHAACLALLHGDLDRAEARAGEALEVGKAAGEPDAVMIYASQIGAIRTLQGRGGEVVGLIEQAAESNPGISGFWAGLASLFSELGRNTEAAEIVRRGAADRFASVPRDQVFATTLSLYSQAATAARVPDGADPLYELLLPWRQQMVWNGAIAYGSLELQLGGLAATLGRPAVADEHFAAATAVHEREGVRVWEARNQVSWARSLLDRDRARDAREHAERAAALAAEHGYVAIGEQAAAVLEAADQVEA